MMEEKYRVNWLVPQIYQTLGCALLKMNDNNKSFHCRGLADKTTSWLICEKTCKCNQWHSSRLWHVHHHSCDLWSSLLQAQYYNLTKKHNFWNTRWRLNIPSNHSNWDLLTMMINNYKNRLPLSFQVPRNTIKQGVYCYLSPLAKNDHFALTVYNAEIRSNLVPSCRPRFCFHLELFCGIHGHTCVWKDNYLTWFEASEHLPIPGHFAPSPC